MKNFDFELALNVLTDELQLVGDEITENISHKIPDWMLEDYDTLQDIIGTLWATYGNIMVTDCTASKREDLIFSYTKKFYAFVKYLMNFEYLTKEYLYYNEK